MTDRPLVGIFVGGRSRRMGGRPKGLLPSPDGSGTLLEAVARACGDAGCDVVLVGEAAAYDGLVPRLPRVADDPAGVGPLGGLHALLTHASRHAGSAVVLSVACDMPHVDGAVLRRLVEHPGDAPVLLPRREGRWEPMLARWRAPSVLPALAEALEGGVRSFQRLIDGLGAEELTLDESVERALVDWDTPADVERAR